MDIKMDEMQEGQNTGFVEVEPQLEIDNLRGGETNILDVPVLETSDWRPFLPDNVCQLMQDSTGLSHGDTNACVSFAGKQSVEVQLNHQLKTGVIPPENASWLAENGYVRPDGTILLSARFTAKLSGTDPTRGNSMPAVWKSLSNDGAVPEALWSMPTSEFDTLVAKGGAVIQDFWDIYYAEVPQNIVDLGKEFAARFPILSEWLVYPSAPASGVQILEDLKVSPLSIGTAVCPGWNTADPIPACGPGTQHGTLMVFEEANGVYDILDHYRPYLKQFAGDYTITYGMRGVVGQTVPTPPTSFHYTFTKQLTFGDSNNDPVDLHALQEALQYLKGRSGQPYLAAGVFGPYGPRTKAAVAAFQSDHGIADPNPGADFGPQTREAMNTLVGN